MISHLIHPATGLKLISPLAVAPAQVMGPLSIPAPLEDLNAPPYKDVVDFTRRLNKEAFGIDSPSAISSAIAGRTAATDKPHDIFIGGLQSAFAFQPFGHTANAITLRARQGIFAVHSAECPAHYATVANVASAFMAAGYMFDLDDLEGRVKKKYHELAELLRPVYDRQYSELCRLFRGKKQSFFFHPSRLVGLSDAIMAMPEPLRPDELWPDYRAILAFGAARLLDIDFSFKGACATGSPDDEGDT